MVVPGSIPNMILSFFNRLNDLYCITIIGSASYGRLRARYEIRFTSLNVKFISFQALNIPFALILSISTCISIGFFQFLCIILWQLEQTGVKLLTELSNVFFKSSSS